MHHSRRSVIAAVTGFAVSLSGCTRDGETTPTPTRIGESARRWRTETGGAVTSSPARFDDRLYIGSDDGSLYAIDRETGAVDWTFETGNAVLFNPLVHDETIYVGSTDANLYAVDTDGSEQWRLETDDKLGFGAAAADGTVYFGSEDGNVYAADAATGAEQWRYRTDAGVGAPPTVAGGTVYVGSRDRTFYAIDVESGTERWTVSADESIYAGALVDGDRVFFGPGGSNSSIYALHRDEGRTVWTLETDYGFSTKPTLVDGTLYIGDNGERIQAIDAASGSLEWRTDIGLGNIASAPTVQNGLVYFGNAGFKGLSAMNAVDRETGDVRWRFTVDNYVNSNPLVVEDTVYFGCHDSYVYAIDATPA